MNDNVIIAGQTEYAGQTTLHPIGITILILLGIGVLFVPRKWALAPFLIMACFISSAQRIVLAGVDFDFLRVMVLFGTLRLCIRKEYLRFSWQSLDAAVLFWAVSSFLFFVSREGGSGVVYRLGFMFDALGMYFLFRCLVNTYSDLQMVIFCMIIISLISSLFFLLESRTGRNLFSVFGGISPVTPIRDGRLRCQGAYSHSILAGCFWASMSPLAVVFWWKLKNGKMWALVGVVCSWLIVLCSASSTPIMGVLAGILGWLFFPLRRQMRLIRWSVFLMLVVLHYVMNGPVWGLVARATAISSSTGWHRYLLIDQAITNFDMWWVNGCSGYTVASWGIHAGDVTNQYVLEGVRGGIITLCGFICVIAIAYKSVGVMWRSNKNCPLYLGMSWALGVCLFVHMINFIGISYFGQINMIWYLLLAIIGSLSPSKLNLRRQYKCQTQPGAGSSGMKKNCFAVI